MSDTDDGTAVVVLVVEDEILVRLSANDMLDQPLQAFESGEHAFLLAKAIVDTVREPLLV
jgi:hypothetical protein